MLLLPGLARHFAHCRTWTHVMFST